MTRQQAEELLRELVSASVQSTKQVNSRRGLTKKAARKEFEAASAIFTALVGDGQKLSPEEWNRIAP